MRKLIVFVFALVVGLFLFHQWWNRLPPFDGHGDPVDVSYEELHSDLDAVRVSGLAHHAVKISRVDPGGLLQSERTYWIWPLFAPGDSSSTRIKTMVASLEEPPWGVDFEEREVVGAIRPLRSFVSPEVEEKLVQVGYDWDPDAYVIQQFEIEE